MTGVPHAMLSNNTLGQPSWVETSRRSPPRCRSPASGPAPCGRGSGRGRRRGARMPAAREPALGPVADDGQFDIRHLGDRFDHKTMTLERDEIADREKRRPGQAEGPSLPRCDHAVGIGRDRPRCATLSTRSAAIPRSMSRCFSPLETAIKPSACCAAQESSDAESAYCAIRLRSLPRAVTTTGRPRARPSRTAATPSG